MSDSQTPEFETDNGFLMNSSSLRDEKYIEELEEDILTTAAMMPYASGETSS